MREVLKILKNMKSVAMSTSVGFTVSLKSLEAVTLLENNNGTEEEQIKQAFDM